ncbi:MAG: hypothetical protein WC202_10745 [Desulfobacterales bacterium]
MDHTNIASQSQAQIHLRSKIDDFFGRFKIATLKHRCGVRKHHGHSVRSLTEAIFTTPFVGKNFFRGIVINSELPFGKDAAYELLKGKTYNWRRLLLSLGRRLFAMFSRLTSDKRESVLIIDDSPYDRSRSKWVELLSNVWDHSTGRFLKGFRMLTICWSDGASCLPRMLTNGYATAKSQWTNVAVPISAARKLPGKQPCIWKQCSSVSFRRAYRPGTC